MSKEFKKPTKRPPPWSRDEHLLALDFYLSYRPAIPGKDSAQIHALSQTLNSLNVKLGGEEFEKFRNPSGVYMKLMNFRRFDPDYHGRGLENGNQDEEIVWQLYADKAAELKGVASKITAMAQMAADLPFAPEISDDDAEGEEGRLLTRLHRYRERDTYLVKRKKAEFLAKNRTVHCEACGFDFHDKYGERGKDFIECHHTKPVSELDTENGKTKLTDLVLLCSNCHRIVHRKRPWLTFEELVRQVGRSNG